MGAGVGQWGQARSTKKGGWAATRPPIISMEDLIDAELNVEPKPCQPSDRTAVRLDRTTFTTLAAFGFLQRAELTAQIGHPIDGSPLVIVSASLSRQRPGRLRERQVSRRRSTSMETSFASLT